MSIHSNFYLVIFQLRKLGLAIICLLCVLTLTSPLIAGVKAQVTITIQSPSKDTFISYWSWSGLPDTYDANANYGGMYWFTVQFTPYGLRRILMEFDLSSIPSGAVISSATLRLFIWAAGGDWQGQLIRVNRVTQSWVEGTTVGEMVVPPVGGGATWNEYNYYDGLATSAYNWGTPGGDYTTVDSATATTPLGWTSWSVTAIVQGWVAGTYPNYGFLIKWDSESGNARGVDSWPTKEDPPWEYDWPTFRPKLEVTYTLPVEGVPEFALTFPVVTSIAVAAYLTIKRRISKN